MNHQIRLKSRPSGMPTAANFEVADAQMPAVRDSDVLRQNREKARLKFLFLQHGWTAERFQAELERRLGEKLEPGVPEFAPEDIYRDHVGIHPQKQDGFAYVGIAVLRGRVQAAQLRALAALALRYGSGDLRTTGMQNLLVLNVPRPRAEELGREVEGLGLRLEGSPFWRGTIACTGSEFCKIALTETKGFARHLVDDLEARLPGFEQHLKIHVTGCQVQTVGQDAVLRQYKEVGEYNQTI